MKEWKCSVCSYEFSNENAPQKCPVCGAETSMILEVKERDTTQEQLGQAEEPVERQENGSVQRKWKCTICNYIHTGDSPPDTCPVCGADSSFFVEVGMEEKSGEEGAASSDSQEQPAVAGAEQTAVADEPEKTGLLSRLIVKHHLHPITVHTPNGVMPLALLLLAGGMVLGSSALDLAALFNMIAVLLSMPVVFYTGYVAWKLKYKGINSYVFKVKFFCALIVAVVLTLMICWRLIQNDIAMAVNTGSYVYLIMGLVVVAAVGIAGHLGGKLVFNR